MLSAQLPYLHIGKSVLREVARYFLEDVVGPLVGHETEVDLRRGAMRKHRLRSRSRIPGLDPTNRARGLVQVALDQLQPGDAEQELIDAEIAAPQIVVPGRRQPAQVFYLVG